ncbi:MAG: hypothetical protein P9L99_03035 [Candidatus Lernaella stagnicola]|nr:hypothetical protein [Candidatus Lernaella stagnicola]
MAPKLVKVAAICAVFVLCVAGLAEAKDLAQRISVGYNHQLSFGVLGGSLDDTFLSNQSISTKYWITNRYGVEGLLGFTSSKYEDDRGFGATIAGRFHANVITYEKNMNVYAGGGLGIIPVSIEVNDNDDNNVGVMAQAFFGFEFFLPGLPNLGFDAEVGLQYLDYDEFQQFGTYGGGFGVVGIRYYF